MNSTEKSITFSHGGSYTENGHSATTSAHLKSHKHQHVNNQQKENESIPDCHQHDKKIIDNNDSSKIMDNQSISTIDNHPPLISMQQMTDAELGVTQWTPARAVIEADTERHEARRRQRIRQAQKEGGLVGLGLVEGMPGFDGASSVKAGTRRAQGRLSVITRSRARLMDKTQTTSDEDKNNNYRQQVSPTTTTNRSGAPTLAPVSETLSDGSFSPSDALAVPKVTLTHPSQSAYGEEDGETRHAGGSVVAPESPQNSENTGEDSVVVFATPAAFYPHPRTTGREGEGNNVGVLCANNRLPALSPGVSVTRRQYVTRRRPVPSGSGGRGPADAGDGTSFGRGGAPCKGDKGVEENEDQQKSDVSGGFSVDADENDDADAGLSEPGLTFGELLEAEAEFSLLGPAGGSELDPGGGSFTDNSFGGLGSPQFSSPLSFHAGSSVLKSTTKTTGLETSSPDVEDDAVELNGELAKKYHDQDDDSLADWLDELLDDLQGVGGSVPVLFAALQEERDDENAPQDYHEVGGSSSAASSIASVPGVAPSAVPGSSSSQPGCSHDYTPGNVNGASFTALFDRSAGAGGTLDPMGSPLHPHNVSKDSSDVSDSSSLFDKENMCPPSTSGISPYTNNSPKPLGCGSRVLGACGEGTQLDFSLSSNDTSTSTLSHNNLDLLEDDGEPIDLSPWLPFGGGASSSGLALGRPLSEKRAMGAIDRSSSTSLPNHTQVEPLRASPIEALVAPTRSSFYNTNIAKKGDHVEDSAAPDGSAETGRRLIAASGDSHRDARTAVQDALSHLVSRVVAQSSSDVDFSLGGDSTTSKLRGPLTEAEANLGKGPRNRKGNKRQQQRALLLAAPTPGSRRQPGRKCRTSLPNSFTIGPGTTGPDGSRFSALAPPTGRDPLEEERPKSADRAVSAPLIEFFPPTPSELGLLVVPKSILKKRPLAGVVKTVQDANGNPMNKEFSGGDENGNQEELLAQPGCSTTSSHPIIDLDTVAGAGAGGSCAEAPGLRRVQFSNQLFDIFEVDPLPDKIPGRVRMPDPKDFSIPDPDKYAHNFDPEDPYQGKKKRGAAKRIAKSEAKKASKKASKAQHQQWDFWGPGGNAAGASGAKGRSAGKGGKREALAELKIGAQGRRKSGRGLSRDDL